MIQADKTQINCKPFLRWAGGKSRTVKHLVQFLPRKSFKRYWEPFLGAGALYLAISPEHAHLADKNAELISCFQAIRDNVALVFEELQNHLSKTSERHYYRVRDQYNNCVDYSIEQAARFLYLNRAGFNGIYRVNQEGKYNVPYGHKEPPPAPSLEDLKLASCTLQNASLSSASYEVTLDPSNMDSGDFVYLDPPYPPLNDTAYFAHYTASRFSWSDHKKLASIANEIKNNGGLVMISNSDLKHVRSLYEGWSLHALPVTRWLAANGTREEVSELVITNYPVKAE